MHQMQGYYLLCMLHVLDVHDTDSGALRGVGISGKLDHGHNTDPHLGDEAVGCDVQQGHGLRRRQHGGLQLALGERGAVQQLVLHVGAAPCAVQTLHMSGYRQAPGLIGKPGRRSSVA